MISTKNIKTFENQDLYWLDFEIKMGLEGIKMLIKQQEISLDSIQNDLKDKMEKDDQLEHLSEEEKSSYLFHYYQDSIATIQELKRWQRFSSCLSIFSFLEGKLKEICAILENFSESKIKLKDLYNQDDLHGYYVFINKVYDIEDEGFLNYYTPLKQQKIIRNIIAHQNGILNSDQKRKIEIKPGLSINEFGDQYQIEIQDVSFLFFLIEKMNGFFTKLLASIDEKEKKKKKHL